MILPKSACVSAFDYQMSGLLDMPYNTCLGQTVDCC